MANPIKETPELYGEDARRFTVRIENPIPETPEKTAKMRLSYEIFMEAMEKRTFTKSRKEKCGGIKSCLKM
jgi:hypothetical protein